MWDQDRYEEVKGTLEPFLKQTGFNTKSDVYFIPVSGFTGANLKTRVSEDICNWYKGPSLLEFLDELQVTNQILHMRSDALLNFCLMMFKPYVVSARAKGHASFIQFSFEQNCSPK